MQELCHAHTIYLLDVFPVLPTELEVRLRILPIVYGEHDGVAFGRVRQPEHVSDLVHGHPQQIDPIRSVGLDAFVVLFVVQVDISMVPRMGEFSAVTVEIVRTILMRP